MDMLTNCNILVVSGYIVVQFAFLEESDSLK